jgi:hypothetical protein
VLKAYLDETGQHEKDYVIIAGHVGRFEEWIAFLSAWIDALGPQRERLHLRKLRWSNPGTRKLLERLGPIPVKSGLKRVIGGTRVSDYLDLISGTPSEILLDGYQNALLASVTTLLLKMPDTERIEIVLEQQDKYMRLADVILNSIATIEDPRLRTKDGKLKLARWTFAPKNRTILFDQADYLCYALLQRCREPNSQKAQWCSSILEGGDTIGEILSREKIRALIAKQNADFGWK